MNAYIGRRRAFAEFAFGMINRFKISLKTIEPFYGKVRRRNLQQHLQEELSLSIVLKIAQTVFEPLEAQVAIKSDGLWIGN